VEKVLVELVEHLRRLIERHPDLTRMNAVNEPIEAPTPELAVPRNPEKRIRIAPRTGRRAPSDEIQGRLSSSGNPTGQQDSPQSSGLRAANL